MQITPIKSKKLTPPFNLFSELKSALKKIRLKEKDIIVITSKVVALAQNRIVKDGNRNKWIKKEADVLLFKSKSGYMTIKDGLLMFHAGIDRSNAGGKLLLFPKDLEKWTVKFWEQLKKEFKLKQLGLIIIDSRLLPLRSGVSSIACAHAGFEGVEYLKGRADIFGRKFKATRVNIADKLANAASATIGEANEQTPFCLIHGAKVEFTDKPKKPLKVSSNECFYFKFLDKK